MSTKCITTKPLDFGDSDSATFKVCTFLGNVLSHMYDQWVQAGSLVPPLLFHWQPVSACPVTTDFKVTDYDFGLLIWSKFEYGLKKNATEPFGCIVRSKADGSLFLVFRGSKSSDDFRVDDETKMVPYEAPTPNPPSGVQVEKGWYAVYNGLLGDLRVQLRQIGGAGQKIIITGHSLGSALATLAVPEAVANNLQVRHYNSASPMVGAERFRTYYESLKVIGGSPGLLKETFRLVNTADSVPNFPDTSLGYVHVGTQISFNADYVNEFGKRQEKKIHDPCCSYAYAIYNPSEPCNPYYDGCAK
ncbi:MAG TPA: hypothetical protein VI756_32625 [Blastocatellia bacterium]